MKILTDTPIDELVHGLNISRTDAGFWDSESSYH